MNARAWWGWAFLAASGGAVAADGLLAPASDSLWPALKARISIQTAAVSPLAWQGLAGADRPVLGISAGALLGDYTFAQPSFGSFRATSGVVIGSTSGALQFSGLGSSRSSLSLASSSGQGLAIDNWAAQPYLGLGFTTLPNQAGLSLSADLGWVGESGASGPLGGRALLGIQGSDSARRDLRLSPLLQVGMRYRF